MKTVTPRPESFPFVMKMGEELAKKHFHLLPRLPQQLVSHKWNDLPWTIFWKQRLHITSAKGVARVLRGLVLTRQLD